MKNVVTDLVLGKVVGGCLIVSSYVWRQVSDSVGGIIDRGFDAGLSIGLLIVGIIVLAWYFHKDKQYTREIIAKLAEDKDKKSNDVHDLAVQQIALLKDQIRTNEEIREALKNLSKKIDDVD